MSQNNSTSHIALNLFAVIAVVFMLYVLKPFIVPLMFAFIFSIIVFPIQRFLERKWRCNRLFATLTSISIIIIISFSLLYVISSRANSLISNSEGYSEKLTQLYYNTLHGFENTFGMRRNKLIQQEELKVENIIKNNYEKITSLLTESGSFVSDVILIPIYIFFFLYYREFFRSFFYKAFRSKSKSFINTIIRKIYEIQRSYLLGLLIVIIIVGILNTIGLLLLGIENAFFFGFLAAFLLLIPYVGIIIGSLLPAMIALVTKDSYWYAIGVVGIFGFIQFIEGNFITPQITGSKVSINAFVAITSLVLFSMLWGIAGMVLALPITATLKILFDNTPGLEAYGFLIGEPQDKHLRSKALVRLKIWRKIRKGKK